jgi:hypothetical protein
MEDATRPAEMFLLCLANYGVLSLPPTSSPLTEKILVEKISVGVWIGADPNRTLKTFDVEKGVTVVQLLQSKQLKDTLPGDTKLVEVCRMPTSLYFIDVRSLIVCLRLLVQRSWQLRMTSFPTIF